MSNELVRQPGQPLDRPLNSTDYKHLGLRFLIFKSLTDYIGEMCQAMADRCNSKALEMENYSDQEIEAEPVEKYDSVSGSEAKAQNHPSEAREGTAA